LSDEVKEVPKGVNGADCLHIVKDNFGNICGSILYESKRTKEFNKEWLDKLKLDSIAAKSDIAVLITKTMPKDKEKTHFKELTMAVELKLRFSIALSLFFHIFCKALFS
ncbi:DUF2130 domain-containing protein, partial [Campylobacter jejuni]|uniref:DUF2130 domain-containing protein n=1 Tax=Campylobacter jejuni TaxID=197 RepID=UPI00207BA80E